MVSQSPRPLVWFVNIDTLVDPSPPSSSSSSSEQEWQFYLRNCLTHEEGQRVHRYVLDGDKKRALVSILLQKAIVRLHLGEVDNEGFVIARTADNKPFMQRGVWRTKEGKSSSSSLLSSSSSSSAAVEAANGSSPPYWNYNASHHNKIVCIGSSADSIIGVDVVDLRQRTPLMADVREFVSFFESQLHPLEVEYILRSDSDLVGGDTDGFPGSSRGSSRGISSGSSIALTRFFTIWALKESYIKAVGSGLNLLAETGYSLRDCRFDVLYRTAHRRRVWGSGFLYVHGSLRDEWTFEFFNVDSECSHLVAVATGPVRQAAAGYQQLAWGLQGSAAAPAAAPAATHAASSRAALAPEKRIVDPLYTCLEERSVSSLLTEQQRSALGHALGRRDLYLEDAVARGESADLCSCALA